MSTPVDPAEIVAERIRDRIGLLQRESVRLDRADQVMSYQRILEADLLRSLLISALRSKYAGIPHPAQRELDQLRAAVRAHRDATVGQGMCWENDWALWAVLGEPDPTDHRPPGWLSFLWNCLRYRWGRRGCPQCARKE